MKFKLDSYHRNTSRKELLDDINNVANILKKETVTIAEYEKYGKFHPSTLQRRFGSWFKVLEEAGLNESRSRLNISEKELFKNIEEIWIKLGRQPKYSEIKNPISKYSAGTYENRFGSYRKALEKFIEYEKLDSTSEEISKNDSIAPENKIPKHRTKREISDRLRFRILMRDGFTCKKCGRSPLKSRDVELHVDHIIPWSKGGETIPDNLETKCEKCNFGKGNDFDI